MAATFRHITHTHWCTNRHEDGDDWMTEWLSGWAGEWASDWMNVICKHMCVCHIFVVAIPVVAQVSK